MKLNLVLGAALLAAFVSCKEKKDKNIVEEIVEIEEVTPETYAEISIKKGGSWKEGSREYDGGAFENVDELRTRKELRKEVFLCILV